MVFLLFSFFVILHMFFFFQAEDGIRDYKVTGVQTCALPISDRAAPTTDPRLPVPRRPAGRAAGGRARVARSEERRVGKGWGSRCTAFSVKTNYLMHL